MKKEGGPLCFARNFQRNLCQINIFGIAWLGAEKESKVSLVGFLEGEW